MAGKKIVGSNINGGIAMDKSSFDRLTPLGVTLTRREHEILRAYPGNCMTVKSHLPSCLRPIRLRATPARFMPN